MEAYLPATDNNCLAARVAEIFAQSYHLAYARLDTDFWVHEPSPNFASAVHVTPTRLRQQPITELLPPLRTAVSQLEEMYQGKRDYYRIDYGKQDNGPATPTTHYTLHLHLIDKAHPQAGLLLIVENHSHLQHMQFADQSDLLLAHKRLAEANAELHRVNQLKSLFMSMAAHDLRTPITTIFGFSDMLLGDLALDQVTRRDIMGVIRAQSERLHRLIADLLDIERIEQGKLILKTADCDLNKIVHEVVESLKPLCEMRRLKIVAQLPNPPLQIYGDEARIWQILYNLVSNAFKYTAEQGQITLTVFQDADEAVLQVSDNGRGIPFDQLERLFDLHYRTHEAKVSTVLGSGLGLYIVKTMVEAHNGTVSVESELGIRTTFTVRLPQDL